MRRFSPASNARLSAHEPKFGAKATRRTINFRTAASLRPLGRLFTFYSERAHATSSIEQASYRRCKQLRRGARAVVEGGRHHARLGRVASSVFVSAGHLYLTKILEMPQSVVSVVAGALDVSDNELAKGSVAKDTRQALSTQERGAVEALVKRGGDPPTRIVCSAAGCTAR
jgi:hypothetical protein